MHETIAAAVGLALFVIGAAALTEHAGQASRPDAIKPHPIIYLRDLTLTILGAGYIIYALT